MVPANEKETTNNQHLVSLKVYMTGDQADLLLTPPLIYNTLKLFSLVLQSLMLNHDEFVKDMAGITWVLLFMFDD